MNSVLLIGNNNFVTSVVGQVRGLESLTVQIAATASNAAQLIKDSRPEVVVVQSCTLVKGSICRTFVQELRSLYFVVIEDRSLEALYPETHHSELLNPELLNPELLNPELLNPELLNPELLNPELLNPELLNPEMLNPEMLNPEETGSEDLGRKEPDLETLYHDYDAQDTFGQTALSAHHEQPASERQQRQQRQTYHSDVVIQRSVQSAQQMAHPSQGPLTADTITPQQLHVLQLERTAIALEAGADAYLWLPDTGPHVEGTANTRPSTTALSKSRRPVSSSLAATPQRLHQANSRLIQAHIRLGLNRSQRYRDLSRINDWLSAVALVDALTQLSNRRAFDIELPRQIRAARDKGLHLSLMVVDIDFFKSVNDRYGHLVGDDVLKNLAKRLLANMRFYDTPFRYGGEEFVITLNKTDLVEATTIADRLRQSMAQKPFDLTHLLGEATLLPVTISIGLTELQADDDEQGRSLLHRADQNLLLAKGAGRNRVVSQ